jgi:SpoVK/Ycf46/Vps4 family AAA+-type ATPase
MRPYVPFSPSLFTSFFIITCTFIRIFTTLGLDWIYVDFAVHIEKRVGRLKAFFEYLFNKATWHRPCVLVLDNIDALLSAEQEVSTPF